MGFKIRTPCNKEHGGKVSQVHILLPMVTQNDYTNIFMKMFLSIFKKMLQHFLKKANSTSPLSFTSNGGSDTHIHTS
jgi:hypothetical protein